MNISENPLLLFAQGAGILLLLSVILLLYNRRIYVDADTKEPIQFELPIVGKLKTQNPVIILFLIGAGLVLYPVYLSTIACGEQATVEGEIGVTSKPVTVSVVPLPRFQVTLQRGGQFKMQIPLMQGVNYRAYFIVDGNILIDQGFELSPNGAKLPNIKFDLPVPSVVMGEPSVPPVVTKEVSDADLRAHGIH